MRVLLLLLLPAVAGCHRASGPPADPPVADPDQKLYGFVQRGSFDLTTVVSDLETIRDGLRELQAKVPAHSEMRDTLDDVADRIDACGADIADFTHEPPAFDEVKKQIPAYADRLKKALAKASDALLTLDDAWGDVGAMTDAPPKGLEQALEDLDGDMEDAYDDLRIAIQEMGGTPPDPAKDDEES